MAEPVRRQRVPVVRLERVAAPDGLAGPPVAERPIVAARRRRAPPPAAREPGPSRATTAAAAARPVREPEGVRPDGPEDVVARAVGPAAV